MILDTLNFIAESFAFIYLGISGFQTIHLIEKINFHPVMIITTVVSLCIVRVIAIAYNFLGLIGIGCRRS
jgi:NhaP-type Na+/H+ or K+/H+ antiporter